MMDNEGLWSEIYADDDLKQAILLYCLSPFDKEDMIHLGLITNLPAKVRIIWLIKSFHRLSVVGWRGTGKTLHIRRYVRGYVLR